MPEFQRGPEHRLGWSLVELVLEKPLPRRTCDERKLGQMSTKADRKVYEGKVEPDS
jgi:hypothetical protein